jgi:hypothetical protein
MALITLLIFQRHTKEKHSYIFPSYAITRYKWPAVSSSNRFEKVMTSTVGKKKKTPSLSSLPLSSGRLKQIRAWAAQAGANKGDDNGISNKSAVFLLNRDSKNHTPCSSRLQSDTRSLFILHADICATNYL